jgi:hypothetical protein
LREWSQQEEWKQANSYLMRKKTTRTGKSGSLKSCSLQ